eukprot:gnl/Chilomastix_cuspidata/6696.p1 GENE.gnl/Chilomastix_cuspidata/6696~~gnl/Chilomastix_cuspidata/6696.p1  ORF type:complete len:551 (-),score=176.98 gnl/Chilomastix_cuspidata/6696:4-1656(-)
MLISSVEGTSKIPELAGLDEVLCNLSAQNGVSVSLDYLSNNLKLKNILVTIFSGDSKPFRVTLKLSEHYSSAFFDTTKRRIAGTNQSAFFIELHETISKHLSGGDAKSPRAEGAARVIDVLEKLRANFEVFSKERGIAVAARLSQPEAGRAQLTLFWKRPTRKHELMSASFGEFDGTCVYVLSRGSQVTFLTPHAEQLFTAAARAVDAHPLLAAHMSEENRRELAVVVELFFSALESLYQFDRACAESVHEPPMSLWKAEVAGFAKREATCELFVKGSTAKVSVIGCSAPLIVAPLDAFPRRVAQADIERALRRVVPARDALRELPTRAHYARIQGFLAALKREHVISASSIKLIERVSPRHAGGGASSTDAVPSVVFDVHVRHTRDVSSRVWMDVSPGERGGSQFVARFGLEGAGEVASTDDVCSIARPFGDATTGEFLSFLLGVSPAHSFEHGALYVFPAIVRLRGSSIDEFRIRPSDTCTFFLELRDATGRRVSLSVSECPDCDKPEAECSISEPGGASSTARVMASDFTHLFARVADVALVRPGNK